jgi:hypothetical protein
VYLANKKGGRAQLVVRHGVDLAKLLCLGDHVATTVFKGNKVSQRTASYITEEDKLLCRVWMLISQDPLCGAEQKGVAYWRRVGKYFYERRKFPPNPFFSDRKDLSLSKTWGFIHAECNKFQGLCDMVKRRKISGLTTVGMVTPLPLLSMYIAYMWACVMDCRAYV